MKHQLIKHRRKLIIGLAVGLMAFGAVRLTSTGTPSTTPSEFKAEHVAPKVPEVPKTPHIKTPPYVRAVYVTSWVATLPERRGKVVELIKNTELNAIIIDIKDYSGKVLFDTGDPEIKAVGSEDIRMKNLKSWIDELHAEGIYVIARLTVFQDPIYAEKFPDQAVQTTSGAVWHDKNKLAFVDVSAKPFWAYIVRIAKAAEKIGFDEINFDYIRFPSDGNMSIVSYPLSGPEALLKDTRDKKFRELMKLKIASPNSIPTPNLANIKSPKQEKLEAFFSYLSKEMSTVGVPISADIFGMACTNYDDLGIGQVLESTAPYFDYVCPMVYPSHYPRNFLGFAKPAEHPYEIVKYSMDKARERLVTMGVDIQKLRPWLQDFNMGATYDAPKVRAQIKATLDAGLHSYLMWDPRNKYTHGAYEVMKNEQPALKPVVSE